MPQDMLSFSILQYIVDEGARTGNDREVKLPPMDELADRLGVSRGKLREDLIAAQAYGMVEMRPGDGTYARPLDFYIPTRTLVLYSIARDRKNFDRFYELRVQLEVAFWDKAALSLTPEDMDECRRILQAAEQKLKGTPVEIPHREHRRFHLFIFSRLDNVFVQGLLKAYWDGYEAVGLTRFFELDYFEKMWASHRAMVDAIEAGRYDEGREVLIQHFTLLQDRLRSR